MSGLVACFAGKIGSGKTSVTNVLARGLQWRRVGFGDYVRAELARRGGDPDVRKDLQDLGQRLAESCPLSLCRAVLSSARFVPGEDLLIDGVRHGAVYRVLVDMVKPSRICLIYLRANDRVRGFRAAERGRATSVSEDSHPSEAELETTIPSMADAVVGADRSLKEIVSRCVDVLETRGIGKELVGSCKHYIDALGSGLP